VIKEELRQRKHEPIPLQGKWLRQVVRGYFAYPAVPTNSRCLGAFRHYVVDLWRRSLARRSQRDRTTWNRMAQLAAEFLPHLTSFIRGQASASPSNTQGGSRCVNHARRDLCGRCAAMRIPTAIAARASSVFNWREALFRGRIGS